VKNCIWPLCIGILLSAQPLLAQQTYFNVPSSDVVDKNKLAVQQQFNIESSYHSATTINYGLGNEFEVGVNLYNLIYDPDQRQLSRNDSSTQMPYGPLVLANAQKSVDLSKNLEIGFGTQMGFNLSPNHRTRFVAYGYAQLAGSFENQRYKWSVGGYVGNQPYLGEGRAYGFQGGFDAGIYKKLHVLGDWISGQHVQGQLVLGVEYYLTKHLPIAVGWQRTNTDGSQSFVIQFTYAPN
jgi:hypothetical protein